GKGGIAPGAHGGGLLQRFQILGRGAAGTSHLGIGEALCIIKIIIISPTNSYLSNRLYHPYQEKCNSF
ncbi:MAG: hypothetical protein IKC45_00920, partial [Clostridia bacterium]|nr:hypothetical protein [Clostridia bacterium]